MKHLLLPILSLFSAPLLAHPGHAPGESDHGLLPLVFMVVLVGVCLIGYLLLREIGDSARDDTRDD
jgi:hypothetical protein